MKTRNIHQTVCGLRYIKFVDVTNFLQNKAQYTTSSLYGKLFTLQRKKANILTTDQYTNEFILATTSKQIFFSLKP